MRTSLSSVEAGLPPGFRFHPKDEELICDYLMRWIDGCPLSFPFLIQVDLNKCEPWDIPETACVGGKEWYFYSQRDRKYATGVRTNRATISGYWKATGKDRAVIQKGVTIGMRKTLVFYQGRAPKGRKTEWVMHEFRVHGPGLKPSHLLKDQDWVLCRVFYKNRREIPSKQGAATGQGATPPSSPSLPGLLDQAYPVPCDGPWYNHPEQVSCFSIFSQTSPNLSHQMLVHLGGPGPSDFGINDCMNPTGVAASNSSCNINNSSFGEAGSSDSYLSEVGLSYNSSSLWINHFH